MLDDYAESMLAGGGDCPLHWHSADRAVTHAQWLQYIQNESSASFINGASTIDPSTDYVFVDSTAGNATLMLPAPSLNTSVTIVRTSAANVVTLDSPTGNINGAATYVIPATAYAHVKVKALNGNYFVVG